GLIRGLHAEKGRIVRALAMDEGNEALVGEFFFAAIRDGDFRRTFQSDVAFVRAESMRREPFNEASAFHTADRCTPTILSESRRQTSAECVRGISPQIFGVIGSIHAF